MTCTVTFHTPQSAAPRIVRVEEGVSLTEAARLAGLEISQPCGGQGRCGRCEVLVQSGAVRRRSVLRLSAEDVAEGCALACQTVVEGDATVFIPEQAKIERRLTTDRVLAAVTVPEGYRLENQTIRRLNLTLTPPSLDDQTDDWSRLRTACSVQLGLEEVSAPLAVLRRLGKALREGDWQVQLVVNLDRAEAPCAAQILDIRPGLAAEDAPLWACAVDIGTTTVSLWLVDLVSGELRAQAAEYNGQIARGEDVISRIIYATRADGNNDLQRRVVETINGLCQTACAQAGADPRAVYKAVVAGNTTMIHLLLDLPAEPIRLAPFVPVVNQPLPIAARDLGLHFCPEALIDCLPGVASYVGADITAGVLASGLHESDLTTLFIDVGTNGEIVLGSRGWMMTCACSAGPAFEGAGVKDGMRATTGAIEEVWIDDRTYEPDIRVIGEGRPRGLCGSGLIALLAELFLAGVIDKAGRVNLSLPTPRVRAAESGAGEYVVAWAAETEHGEDIVITRVDIDNLLRAKAAIYAGFTVLAEKVGLTLADVQQLLIGGSFGKYINVEKAIQIGLLPDLPWETFQYLGNTSVKGAYLALLDAQARAALQSLAAGMTYVELSADNMFFDAFTSALFLPNTDLSRFPSVQKLLAGG